MKRIIFFPGAFSASMLTYSALAHGRALLAQHGVWLASPYFSLTPFLTAGERTFGERTEHPGVAALTEYLLKQSAECGHCDTLLFIQAGAFLLQNDLPIFISVIKKCFPKATLDVYVSLARQDAVLESATAYALLHSNMRLDKKMIADQQGYFHYLETVASLTDLAGQAHLHCHVEKAGPTAHLMAQTRLWDLAGVSLPEEQATGVRVLPPSWALDVPREFYCFCGACNRLQPTWYPSFFSPWIDQTRHFSGAGVAEGLYSPTERAAFLAGYAAENAQTAHLLKRDTLFAPVDTDITYERVNMLTHEAAREVAERLDRSFARKLLGDFETVPEYYLDREQRLAHQALRDTLLPRRCGAPVHKSAPKVSVLTLTYNHANFIEDCIKSVLAQQTDFPIEHIIADDASDDGTRDIILGYAKRHPHIIPVFQKEHSSGPRNIQALFDMARSPYVALCDGDDYFADPKKLQTQADFLDANPECALCFHPVQVVYEDGTERSRVYPPEEALPRGVRPFYYLTDILRCNIIQTNSVMYRWRFRDGLPPWFRADITPGDWYWHLLHAELGKVGFINTIMSVYRRHKQSVYYTAEINPRLHRSKLGMAELETFAVINEHFKGKYQDILNDMALGVFTDVLLYQDETGDEGPLESMVDRYPDFARYFFAQIRAAGTP